MFLTQSGVARIVLRGSRSIRAIPVERTIDRAGIPGADNCEHPVAAAGNSLSLQQTGATRVLATSRQPLQVSGG